MGHRSKKRRQARRPAAPSQSVLPDHGGVGGFPFRGEAPDVDDVAALLDAHVAALLHRLDPGGRGGALTGRATELTRRFAPLPASSVRRVVEEVVGRVIDSRVKVGWCPDDLDQIVRRDGAPSDRPVLAAWLQLDLRRSEPEGPWREQVERFEVGTARPRDEVDRIAAALRLGALLQAQTGLPDTTTRRTPSSAGPRTTTAPDSALTRKLATVRGLLAKAESTTFDEEAEALSAKAQELISRYALERLLDADSSGVAVGGPTARRVWLEAPYVGAKAALVHQVAKANRSRCVLSEPPGVCTVVGDDADLDAVELLVTSLLVQASAAMLRHGRAVDARGASRTRSFRQSFLMAFAVRIGERLAETAEQVLRESEHQAALLPVLRSRDEAVEEAFRALVPTTRKRTTTVSNAAGWRAGTAAADLAAIDVRRRIAEGDERAG